MIGVNGLEDDGVTVVQKMTFFTDLGEKIDGYMHTMMNFMVMLLNSYLFNFEELGSKLDKFILWWIEFIRGTDEFIVALLAADHKYQFLMNGFHNGLDSIERNWEQFLTSRVAKRYIPELKYVRGWKVSELVIAVTIVLLTISLYHIRKERKFRNFLQQRVSQYQQKKEKETKKDDDNTATNTTTSPSKKLSETEKKIRTMTMDWITNFSSASSWKNVPDVQSLDFSTGSSWERRIQTLAMFSCSLAFLMPGIILCYAFVFHFGFMLPVHVFIIKDFDYDGDGEVDQNDQENIPKWYFIRTGITCGFIWLYLFHSFLIDTSPTTGKRYPYFRTICGRFSKYWWSSACDFLPVVLVKTAELPPTRKYIVGNSVYRLPASYVLGYHPHGIIAVGAFCAFCTNGVRTLDLSQQCKINDAITASLKRQNAIDNNDKENDDDDDDGELTSELFAENFLSKGSGMKLLGDDYGPPLRDSALELLQDQLEAKKNLRGFSSLFPNLDRRLVTLPINFSTPFLRDYFLGMGAINSQKETFRNYLNMDLPINGDKKTNPTIGRAMCVVVGGAAESLLAHENKMELVLQKRRGFVREAIMADANLVPVLGFGETNLYTLYDDEEEQSNNDDEIDINASVTSTSSTGTNRSTTKKMISGFQKFVYKTFGFAIPLFTGRSIFFKSLGVMPKRKPVVVVVGKPIPPPTTKELMGCTHKKFKPLIDRKTDEPINEHGRILKEWHTKYVTELENLYNNYKDAQWNHPGQLRHESLRIVR